MMRVLQLVMVFAVVAVAFASEARAEILDLGHPIAGSVIADNIGDEDRNIVFNADSTFSITSAGIRFDPLDGGAAAVEIQIWDMASTGGVGSRNSLLATAVTPITDVGLAFYDVLINFTFNSGTRYNVAFLAPGGWGFEINDMEFYFFHFPDAQYSVGPVTVMDGGQGAGTDGGFGNTVMPHVRLNSDGPEAVPEPASMTLVGIAAAGLGLGALRRRRANKSAAAV